MKQFILIVSMLFSLNSIKAQTKSSTSISIIKENGDFKNKSKGQSEHSVSDDILADLLSEKIISNTENVSFTLNFNSFVVNNTEMTEDVRNRYKKKYEITKGNTISCTRNKTAE